MNYGSRVTSAVFCAAALLLLASGCSPGDPARPSVLLISLDTVRADHLSCYGYTRPTTPNLDRLAAEGTRFDNFVAVSSWTLPTHASLFTGLFPSTHGSHYRNTSDLALSDALGDQGLYSSFRATRLPEEAITLAETLSAAGYAAGGIGAGPWLKPVFGLDQGFGFYDCDTDSPEGRRADEVNALAFPFLRRHADEPFFLFLNYFDAHEPYSPPGSYRWRFFDPAGYERVGEDPVMTQEFILSQYDGEIAYVDHHIGLLLDELRRLGAYDRTWIVAVSDHGEAFGEHGLRLHGFSLYESEVRGVLIVKPPRGLEGRLDPLERSQHVDLMPTLLEQLGVPLRSPVEGQPLGRVDHPIVGELFRNEGNVRWKGPRFDRDLRAVYDGPYKLIRSSREGDQDSGLFDLERDPQELHDLSTALPDVASSLLERLRGWNEARLPPLETRPPEQPDEETLRQLRSLGYVE